VIWGAHRFTEGAVRAAALLAVSPFYVGIVVSGFEPENLVTGVAAAWAGLGQVALGTVIGSAIFLLTGALGLTLVLVPMAVGIPGAGPVAMTASLVACAGVLWGAGLLFGLAAMVLKARSF
jgi:Ca2+/Na+ antiporter